MRQYQLCPFIRHEGKQKLHFVSFYKSLEENKDKHDSVQDLVFVALIYFWTLFISILWKWLQHLFYGKKSKTYYQEEVIHCHFSFLLLSINGMCKSFLLEVFTIFYLRKVHKAIIMFGVSGSPIDILLPWTNFVVVICMTVGLAWKVFRCSN